MSALLDAAKARAAKQAAELAASLAAAATVNAAMADSLGGVSTGMASSADLTQMVNSSIPLPTEAEPEYPVGPQGSYKSLNLKRFFKASGSKVAPVEGYFIPADGEESAILAHFATQWGMVELVPAEAPAP